MERKKTIGFKVSEEEQIMLQQSAHDLGMSVSQYIRAIALQGIERVTYDPELHAVIREIHADCRRIASDIHDIAVQHSGDVNAAVAVRQCEGEMVSMHKTLRKIEEKLKQT